ncbi:T9SS type A sorting domain-containing protein [Saccharicrinis sp. FJH54]|uniref:T9SS type A sorting domain-containing protein n=1 Tax=Saccharicrinis sp. FJH54 TaxID=3344665 RepID=UPI0035D43CC7
MKKLLIFIIILISVDIFSQEYHKFIEDPDKYWDVAQFSNTSICEYENFPKRFFISEDTVISYNKYKKVFYFDFRPFDSNNGYCPPFLIDTVKQQTNYFIREDTLNRKVFKLKNGIEVLLYNFNLSVGDTILDPNNDNTKLIIDSINYIITSDNIRRKAFYFSDKNDYGLVGEYIEGIGGSEGPFEFPIEIWGEIGIGVLCIHNDNKIIYGTRCNEVTQNNTSFLNNSQVNVFPNPATDYIAIEIADINLLDGCIELIDISGHKIDVINIGNALIQYKTDQLKSGMYMLRFIKSGKVVGNKPFYKN